MFLPLVPQRGKSSWLVFNLLPPRATGVIISQEIRTHQSRLRDARALQLKGFQPYERVATNTIE